MKRSLLLVTALCPVLLISLRAYSQQVIATAGGSGHNGGNTIDWTLGETVIATLSGSNTSLTQGFHQPTLDVATVDPSDKFPFAIEVYPNPFRNYLVVKLQEVDTRGFRYQLYDMTGKLLEEKVFDRESTILPMEDRLAGIYLLKIMQEEKELKTYEIIKY